ncbi:hypothetical protein QCA50_011715 [Cerrena zonata]|uniref:Uncharacterized protein n=1 Tax=Cerrena zonata TaxID=2478898 RepID=A0AAW0G6Q3_9APHY
MAIPSIPSVLDQADQTSPGYAPSLNSLSRVGTFRSGTIRGIGSDSGRAFLALGVLVLRGMEDLDNNITLRRLSNEIRELSESFTPISSTSLQTLLDVAQSSLCSEFKLSRIRVWTLLVAVMQTRVIAEEVWSLICTRWYREDQRHLLQLLGIFRLSLEDDEDDTSAIRQALMKNLRAVCTSRDSRILICNACQVFSAVVQREDPAMLLEVFKPEFVGLVTSLDYLANPERYGRLRTIPPSYRRAGKQLLTGFILINQ